jgi:hypothetical protein
MRLFFWRVRLHYVKAGRLYALAYGLKKRHEGCRFYPSRKTRQYYHYSSEATITSTEKAEQLDGIVITQRILLSQ